MTIKTVGVVGTGTMGSGIAQTCAQNGFSVLLYDINDTIVQKALNGITKRLQILVGKGKITEKEFKESMDRIETCTELSEMKRCDLVIEAVPEKLNLKKEVFRKLDEICSEETILVTNTSSFSVTDIASVTNMPRRVAGLHFFNPAPLMPLVEVVKGIRTSKKIVNTLNQFVLSLRKEPVTCEDTPGFIVNRIARPFYNEALKIAGERLATMEQIDRIMKKAGNFKMGPFELQDLIGIDVNFSTTESVYQGFFGEGRFRPHYLQQRMLQSGKIGRKVGEGYFRYEN
ncbi:3-hydroxyacyl-CoA dehydrogenase NAD-binding domain-containing protein [Parageobacillus toebii]|uniref:3-hydroxyacyl-CoA dehydrogenase NAD-binding domain-containing protein n=1 Tax=Parageobacillus toebii TaxID=153151 RepID=UPI002E202FD8|nr:3-hydroxyacyl-CoA dehydrogenase NAD-binding domain-containing protein [Parageobacillus toebii]MED4968824.1 3-hydroxyacyl-CoA dehydrogenase NAD-binding domain-containing protein [Parageobacillus toebii]MED4990558.1 3-hydroxyacyl-CoA dehydrogenase NAD-binding domain-containing protein [Parageobacillus toebii]